ncbi:MAG: tRNA uridine-5-carboxymethylaminomethyl(34) synthesis GTPase MnmE [Nitrospinae bacterium]|nr:tRNA uridine-5-carboxymethylaminomethyl(34) synthesis GTPase MnmE [Nitrospinota bacterium]
MTKQAPIRQLETIAAISTAIGEGGLSMVRLSGVDAIKVASEIYRTPKGGRKQRFAPRHATLGHAVDETGARIDEIIITVMESPRTYTREDIAEITCHGGPVVVKKILSRVLALGARMAQPGEFSKRAFLNGRIDLLQAEAIIDMIRARSEKGWKTAFSQLDGRLSQRLSHIENELLNVMADLEASIDFPEEEIEIARDDVVTAKMGALKTSIEEMIASYGIGRIYREGISVAIIGRPNVGKSSLMNALLERERVIVTPHPGTTRDTVEETLQIEGISVKIIDTAGLRQTEDMAEQLGVERSIQAGRESDVALFVFDGSEPLTEEDRNLITQVGGTADLAGRDIIPVINKSDRGRIAEENEIIRIVGREPIRISAKTGEGLAELREKMVERIESKGELAGDGPPLTRERHLEQLRKMADSVERAIVALDRGMSREFVAADLADAKESLEELTGKVVSEQVLDKIFNEFCIGK